jgi:GxxExxY protein
MTIGIDQLTYLVNGRAMEIHREIGPGVDEIVYHEWLSDKLNVAGIDHQLKPRACLIHRGLLADEFEADIIIPHLLCVECKAIRAEFAPDHLSQILSYQKFWGIRTGLLFNFGRQSLAVKRMLLDPPEPVPIAADDLVRPAPLEIRGHALAQTLAQAMARLYTTYGLGYRATTYRGLLLAELRAERVSCSANVTTQIPCRGKVREVSLDCIFVEQQCPVMVLALQDQISASDRAVLQTFVKHLGASWGLAVDFGKHQLQVAYVRRPRASQGTGFSLTPSPA